MQFQYYFVSGDFLKSTSRDETGVERKRPVLVLVQAEDELDQKRSSDNFQRPHFESYELEHYSRPSKKTNRPSHKNQGDKEHHFHYIPVTHSRPPRPPKYLDYQVDTDWDYETYTAAGAKQSFESLVAFVTTTLAAAVKE